MASDVDWLVCIAPGRSGQPMASSRASVLEALGPEGSLVSIGRGTSVDRDRHGRDAGYRVPLAAQRWTCSKNEPHVPEALFDLDNVVLSPHQGSATHKTRWSMGDLVVRNLTAHFAGKPLISPVV